MPDEVTSSPAGPWNDPLAAAAWAELARQPHLGHRFAFRRFSRREFIRGGIAGLASASVAVAVPFVAGTGNDNGLRILHDDGEHTLTILYKDPTVADSLEYTWKISGRDFGPNGEVSLDESIAGERHAISLRNAHFHGTVLEADFRAKISWRGGRWYIELRLSGLPIRELPLMSWLDKKEPGIEFPLADGTIIDSDNPRVRLETKGARIQWRPDLAPRILAGTGAIAFRTDAFECNVVTATVSAWPVTEAVASPALLQVLKHPRHGIGRIELELVRDEMPAQSLGQTHLGQTFACEWTACHPKLYLVGTPNDARGCLLINGAGQLRFDGLGAADHGTRFRTHGMCTLSDLAVDDRRTAVAAWFDRLPFGIEGRDFAITARHRDGCGLLAVFGGDVRLVRATGDLVGIHIPVAGTSGVEVRFTDTPLTVGIGEPSRVQDNSPVPDGIQELRAQDPSAAAIKLSVSAPTALFGRETSFSCPLANTRMRVQRNMDRLELEFEFPGHRLVVDKTGCRLQPIDGLQPLMIVHFPPQHVFEEARTTSAGDAGEMRWIGAGLPSLGVGDWLSRSFVSGPTRLVFELPVEKSNQLLTADWLTEWSELSLVVHRRAKLSRQPATLEQLRAVSTELEKATDGNVAAALIKGSLTPPSPTETAIEAVAGLILSPNQSAKFVTSRTPSAAREHSVWAARLEFKDKGALRAIYADGMKDALFEGDAPANKDRFVSSVSRFQRQELAISMSVYGLPALRRLVRDPSSPNPNDVHDDPTGQVQRPEKPYYIKGADEGFFNPRPFDEGEIALGTTGASIKLRWEAEPPAGAPTPTIAFKALNIERYEHETAGGWDAHVRICEKGFLAPLGHRASWVTLTQREFHPFRGNPDQVDPTGYLVQHRFIVCRRPLKSYPALYQPFASRDFPAETVTMLTTVTPDVVGNDPARTGTDPSAAAFWPRGADGQDIVFRYAINGDKHPVSSPLLFVFNSEVHEPQTVKAVVEAYNAAPIARRTAQHGGVDRVYAPPNQLGDTSFPTHEWVMQMRGRALTPDQANDVNTAYAMDALMEGADQPPFYPYCDRMTLTMATVDRLLGMTQGRITTTFQEAYRRGAFDPSGNASELYLQVLQPEIRLDFSGQGDTAGGIAKPNATLAAISRRAGLVGGRRLPPGNPGGNRAAHTSGDLQFDLGQASAGMFDPSVFFSDAKLLGLIALRDLVRLASIAAAPVLNQVYEYAPVAEGDVRNTLAAVGNGIVTAVEDARKAAAGRLDDTFGIQLTLAECYPDLDAKLSAVEASAQRLKNKNLAMAELWQGATALVADGKRLLVALEQVAANPTPAFVKEVVELCRNARQNARDLVDKFLKAAGQQLRQQAIDEITGFANALVTDDVFEAIFGVVDAAAQNVNELLPATPNPDRLRAAIRDLLADPASFAARMEETAFYEVYGRSFLRAFAAFATVFINYSPTLTWTRTAMRDAAREALGASGLNLPEIDPTVDNLVIALTATTLPINEQLSKTIEDLADRVAKRPNLTALARQLDNAIKRAEAAGTAAKLQLDEQYRQAARDSTKEAAVQQLAAAVYAAKRDAAEIRALQITLKQKPEKVRERIKLAIKAELNTAFHAAQAVLQIADTTRRDLGHRAQQLVRDVVAHLADSAQLAALALDQKVVDRVWALAADVIVRIVPPTEKVVTAITSLDQTLNGIEFPAELPPQMRADLFASIALTRQTLKRAAEVLIDFEQIRQALSTEAAPPMAKLPNNVRLLGRAFELRRRAVAECGQVYVQCHDAALSASALAASAGAAYRDTIANIQVAAAEALIKLGTLLIDLTVAPCVAAWNNDAAERWQTAKQALDNLPGDSALGQATRKAVTDITSAARTLVDHWQRAVSGEIPWSQMADELHAFMSQSERILVGDILGAIRFGSDAANALADGTRGFVNIVAAKLAELDDDVANALAAMIPAGAAAGPLGALAETIAKPLLDTLRQAKNAIGDEATALHAIAQASTSPVGSWNVVSTRIHNLLDTWSASGPAVAAALSGIEQLFDHVVHGQLGGVLDVEHLKSLLEDAIAQLAPTKVTLNFSWSTALGSFPANDPIFEMEPSPIDADGSFILPTDGGQPVDLKLATQIQIDLRNGKRTASAVGEIGPFNIRLLGGVVDLLTIRFKGARFVAQPGQQPHLEAHVDRVEMGSALEFVSALQSLMSPGADNAPHVIPSLYPPGIELTYGYARDMIMVGSLQLLNVAISVSMLLPFDDRQAEFRFAFASRDKPFLIVEPPYGGGGFVALTASARGITGFEISFEFGAILGLSFGPFKGHGRVSAGIYLMQSASSSELQGFVHAVGEGQVACFGIAVAIEVAIRQENGGDMVGSSTYSVSFRLGFASVSYRFTASYTVHGGSGGGRPTGLYRNDLRRDLSDRPRFIYTALDPAGGDTPDHYYIICNAPRKLENWGKYRRYVAIEYS